MPTDRPKRGGEKHRDKNDDARAYEVPEDSDFVKVAAEFITSVPSSSNFRIVRTEVDGSSLMAERTTPR